MHDLTVSHHHAIRNVLANYNICGDNDDLEGLSNAFSPNGTLALSNGRILTGRLEIVSFLQDRRTARAASAGTERRRGHHHLSTTRVDLLDERSATAQSYFLVLTAIGPDHSGTYRDRLVRSDAGWLIVGRQVSIEWVSDHSHWFAGQ